MNRYHRGPREVDDRFLPGSTQGILDSVENPHPGLRLDKFSFAGEQKDQKDAIERVSKCSGDKSLLDALLARRAAALDDLGAVRYQGKTEGALTLHLSRSGSLENAGIALHPVYGFGWLPGTGLKGMARAWAETNENVEKDQIETIFGTQDAAGRIVFHDAWPLRWPRLEVDIVNNHHAEYYNEKGYPGDWEGPVPVYFLTIAAGTGFDFALSDRSPADDGLLDLAGTWLRAALVHAGAGAKTAAGYGRITLDGDPVAAPAAFCRSEHRLELIGPAFLAGASQKEADCDLRPATLRGLLRWWWRTMHAGHLGRGELLQLETAVWGSADEGSPLSIFLVRETDQSPQGGFKRVGKEHDLERPRDRKTTQGLFYAGYGMDEKGKSRWFRDTGERWRITLAARARNGISAQELMDEAEAALWLLARYGGAGSRSRKGFGSFADIEIEGIASDKDCIERARRFREVQGLHGKEGRCVASVLDDVLTAEVETKWKDAWYALDQAGTALQMFAKSLEANERLALGLPREVGRQKQRVAKGDRHASPAHWSLARNRDGCLTIRLIAFPADELPDRGTSQRVLGDLVEFAREHLSQRAKERRSAGQKATNSGGTRPRRTGSSEPEAGSRVQARLLEERTRKGGWKVKLLEAELIGSIMNSEAVPADAQPGQQVEIFFRGATNFDWPTPETEQWHEKHSRPKAEKPRRGSGGRRRP